MGVVVNFIRRFDVYLVQLGPTKGSEIRKTRPCVIISPNEMLCLKTVIIAPMTTKGFNFPTRIPLTFQGKKGQIVLDQIRTIDKSRLTKRLGKLSEPTAKHVSETLVEIFTE